MLLSVRGDVDMVTEPQLRAALDRLATQHRTVALDLSAVHFMDSTGVRLLLAAMNESRRDGWTFLLAGELPDAVARLFLTGLTDVLPLGARRE